MAKTQDQTQDQAEAAAPARKELKLGETVLFSGVYGTMVNPDDAKNIIGHGTIVKVKVDQWYLDQYNAGKLAIAE